MTIIKNVVPDPADVLAAERAQMTASAMQVRLALEEVGRLQEVEALVANGTVRVQIAWDKATSFPRNSPMIAALAGSASPPFTDAELDTLFRRAMEITV